MGIEIYGERNVIDAFRRHSPDYVLIVEAQESFLGPSTFGRDYGSGLWQWIKQNYRYDGKFAAGRQPIELWERNPQVR
jgi:hypothetical protein